MTRRNSEAPAPARETFTIKEFCQAHHISRAKLYGLWNAGHGPRRIQDGFGTKNLISVEAAADWKREREAATAAAAAARQAAA
jgi:hypothetical protein